MYLEPSTINEIISCIGFLNVKKAVGHDNNPPYFLKIAAPNLTPYLRLFFFDFVFTHGIFPGICKIAKTVPIHTKGEKNNPKIFRPIPILNCFSKILEKMIHQRIFPFCKYAQNLDPTTTRFSNKSFNYAWSAKSHNSNSRQYER